MQLRRQNHIGFVDDVRREFVRGWCASRNDINRPVVVRVERAGTELARGLADTFRSDLWDQYIGTGRHGFQIKVPGLRSLDEVQVYPDDSDKPLARSATQYQAILPILPGSEVVQTFVARADHLSSVSFLVARSGGRPASKLSFSLSELDGGASPKRVITLDEEAGALWDNEYFDLSFSPIASSEGSSFALSISSSDAVSDNAAAVVLDDGSCRIDGHVDCVVGGQSQRDIGLVAVLNYSPQKAQSVLPLNILYSPVSQCNLNCVHCISRDTRNTVHRLPAAIREEIRSWCRRGLIESIGTDYSGDILWADDRWGGELDFLIDLNVPFHIDTNGTHLTLERGRKLIYSKMSSLNVSLDAARPETYKRIRRGSSPLDYVLKNASDFVELRDQEGAKGRIGIFLGFTMMCSNLEEICEFIDIGARLGVDRIQCRHIEAYTPEMAAESLLFSKERFNEVRLAAIELAARLGIGLGIGEPLEERPSRPGHRFCSVPWSAAVILGNGDVQVCCIPKTKIGNLHEQTMEQLWDSEIYKAFRAAVNSDKAPACCNSCPMFRRPGNIQSYLPFQTIDKWVPPYQWKS